MRHQYRKVEFQTRSSMDSVSGQATLWAARDASSAVSTQYIVSLLVSTVLVSGLGCRQLFVKLKKAHPLKIPDDDLLLAVIYRTFLYQSSIFTSHFNSSILAHDQGSPASPRPKLRRRATSISHSTVADGCACQLCENKDSHGPITQALLQAPQGIASTTLEEA